MTSETETILNRMDEQLNSDDLEDSSKLIIVKTLLDELNEVFTFRTDTTIMDELNSIQETIHTLYKSWLDTYRDNLSLGTSVVVELRNLKKTLHTIQQNTKDRKIGTKAEALKKVVDAYLEILFYEVGGITL